MTLDIITQHTTTLQQSYTQYVQLLQQQAAQQQKDRLDPKVEEKIAHLKEYMLKLIADIQKAIDEEREHAYR